MNRIRRVSGSDNDDRDSFYSFNASDESFNEESLLSGSERSITELEHETTQENEIETATVKQTLEPPKAHRQDPGTSKVKLPLVLPKPPALAAGASKAESSSSESCNTKFKPPRKLPNKVEPLPVVAKQPMNLWDVPKPSASLEATSDAFDMDGPNIEDHLAKNDPKEKAQKHAFTEIWLDSQQMAASKPKPSPLKHFSAALEVYFNKSDRSSKESDKSAPATDPSLKNTGNFYLAKPSATSTPAAKVEEPYVSSLPPPDKDSSKEQFLAGDRKVITLPGGYDLNNLKKYKNPNHWAIRPHVSTGKHIPF
ncbi:hypothetical protein KR018_001794 [Drosophila ironensis]|nr:hypothetical protein KR018_001794 [Drosophila ironensis]